MNIKFIFKSTMKYFLVVFVFFAYTQNILAFSGEGDGLSAETAFIITTCAQLQEMNGEFDAYYKIGNDIDCAVSATWNENTDEWVDGVVGGTLIDDEYVGVVNNGYSGFEPIGRDDSLNGSGNGFTGTLDGQNYTISNLWIFRKDQNYTGLIGYATNATIKNLTLDNAQIVGQSDTGGFLGYGSEVSLQNLTNNEGMVRAYLAYDGGGIAGEIANGSVATQLTVTGGTVHGSGNVIGGLVGKVNNGTVTNSSTGADVDGGEYVGGAFGEVEVSSIDNVDATGDVVSNDGDDLYIEFFSKNGYYTGGFAGRIYGSTIDDSTASGAVTAEGNHTGGFAGEIEGSSQITDSSATGIVSGDEYVGGFAGSIDNSTIVDTFSTGNVTSLGSYAGGFTGESLCGSSFLRASASGDVESGNSYVGGFTGYDACEGSGSTFTLAAAHGDVQGNNVVGGFIGYGNVSTFTNVYSSGSVTANDQVGSFASDITSSNLDNVYARGLVTVTGGTFFGGFAKDATDTTIRDSFWDSESIGVELACQTGACVGLNEVTTVQAKTQSTYTDASWNFSNIWEMSVDNDGYPSFLWESFGPMLGTGKEEDPYQVTQCFDATESGYYELQNNIIDVLGSCILIEADDVFIDGDGHTIVGEVDNEGVGIFTTGYDSVSISDITIESFDDAIRLYDVHGESSITNVTIASTYDDGIDIRGVDNFTITDANITDIYDRGISIRQYINEMDESIRNTNVVIENVIVDGAGEYGMELDYITTLRISNSEISNTGDDGFNSYAIEDVEIVDNILQDIGSDGIYIEQGTDVQILRNTINGTPSADGIDIDDDSDELGNTGFIVTDNILTSIGDVGMEIADLHDSTITNNTMEVNDMGIDVFASEGVTFTGNTITPTTTEFFTINSVTTESVALDIVDAENSLSTTYDSFTYTLPFTFNYMGRDITAIQVNVNGSVELFEDGESCLICGDSGDYKQSLESDVIFASFDELNVSDEGSYAAVFNQNDESVVVEWRGTTFFDNNVAEHPIHFQVVLYPNGEVQWNFIQMDFVDSYNSMFTGAYDVEAGELYRAGLDISDPSSFRANLSGAEEYELVEGYDSIGGIRLTVSSDITFLENSIHATLWVESDDSENIIFNDTDSGNTYKLLNGEGAWIMFDIVDTDGNGYADSGSDRPFSESILGATYWAGGGQDEYPATLTTVPVETPEVRKVTTSGSYIRSKRNTGDDNDRDGKSDEDSDGQKSSSSSTNNAPVLTTRQLQRFLNTNGFPVALTGPGSLNNETDTFGELTRQALIKFQQANGITPALGIFGPITKAFINKNSSVTNTNSPTTPQSSRDLELGMSGADVTKLQEFLIKSGHSISAGVTGYFGQQTKDALIAYQKANNILPASGYFGPKTRSQMKTVGLVL